MPKLMINGHKVSRQFKREWTRHQLTNKWTIEDWLYRLQLVQYKLDEKKRIEYCGDRIDCRLHRQAGLRELQGLDPSARERRLVRSAGKQAA